MTFGASGTVGRPVGFLLWLPLLALPWVGCNSGDDPAAAPEVPPEIAMATFAEESCCDDPAPCQDEYFCNGAETCNCWGDCEPSPAPVNCDDGKSCTTDACDESVDGCVYVNLCDDGDDCTMNVCNVDGTCSFPRSPLPGCGGCLNDADCDDTLPCTSDRCNRGTGVCTNTNEPLGTSCDDGVWCNGVDACDGVGACSPGLSPCSLVCETCNEAAATCDILAGWCRIAGACYGAGATNPANQCQSCQPAVSQTAWSPKPNGTGCNDGQYCTLTDTCNAGSCNGAGARCPVTGCVTGCNEATDACTFAAAGTSCSDGLWCDGVEACNGAGACIPGSNPCSAACQSCNEALDLCQVAVGCFIGGACYASGATNPANQCQWCDPATSATAWTNKPGGTACNDGQYCTLTDTCNAGACNGAGARCPVGGCTAGCNEVTDACTPAAAGTICAGAAGACETNGVCNGTTTTCPGTTFRPNTYICRSAAAGGCDLAEYCSGSSAECPGDAFQPNTFTCRASAGACDPAENCPGGSAVCPADVLQPGTFTCRASAGPCDIAENCTGGSAACPANAFQPATTVCRAGAGACDIPENCPGGAAACPVDAFRGAGFPCRASAGACDVAETCPGASPACPADGFAPNTTVCRASIGSCDAPETCPGTGTACPGDVCRAAGTTGYCAADAFACTIEPCNGTCGAGAIGCTTQINVGCLIGGVCYAEGTVNPSNQCQWCQGATSRVAWTNRPLGTACAADTHACTADQCDGAGACTHPITAWASNDVCNGSALTPSGSGATMVWTGSGDTYCGRDNYTSTCGGGNANGDQIDPDLVHYFDVPTEYASYRYRVEVAGPAAFNPVQYYYQNAAGCGVGGYYYSCSDAGPASCWTWRAGSLAFDGDDACQRDLFFPIGRNYVVADSVGAGNTYQIRVDRRAANTGDCSDPPLPEMQLGGTWLGNTCTSATYWWTNMPYCVQSTYTSAYRFNFYHVNHATAPFNTLNRGYVAWVDGTVTPGGFNNTLFFAVNQCSDPWYLFSCDNDTFHYRNGSVGNGSMIATGRVRPGWWAGIGVTNYPNWACGNYTLRVERDEDGDAIMDSLDGSNALMRGATSATAGEDGAIQIPAWPWAAHGQSYDYPNNSLAARPGREVYYYRTTGSTSNMRVRLYPRVRGDVWVGAASFLWDGVIWIYTPTSVWAWCRGAGWFWTTAGGWRGCDVYGNGGYEEFYLQNAPAGTYRFAVDSYTATPRGGWYTIEFVN
ncbi:MAG: hypothetical protein HY907_18610 [Deltaproteobacteria bacterium]|nr:hypothetical protein [Deltaproteobacteria bacterium]